MLSTIQSFHLTKLRFFVTLLVMIVIIILLGWLFTGYLSDQARRTVMDDGKNAGLIVSLHMTGEIKKMESMVQALAELPAILPVIRFPSPSSLDQANKTLDRYRSVSGASVCYLMDTRGLTIASSNRESRDSFVGQYFNFRSYFKEALGGARSLYIGLGATTGRRGFYMSCPVRDREGRIVGVVAMKKDLDELEKSLSQYRWFLVARNGVILASPDPEMRLKSLWPLDSVTHNELLVSGQFGPGPFDPVLQMKVQDQSEVTLGGDSYLVIRHETGYDGWSVILFWPIKQISVYRAFGIILTLLIGCLFVSFHTTIYIVKRAADKVRDSERRLSDIIEFLPDATMAINKDKQIIIWNRAIEAMTGVSAKDMIGRGDYAYTEPFYGEARPQLMDLFWEPHHDIAASYPQMTREGDKLVAEVFCPALYNGRGAHVWLVAAPLRDAEGRLVGAIESIRDITGLKRTEDERQRLGERLNRAEKMESLGTLAGGVAHDLNNVLGVLVGYSELLVEKIPQESPLKRFVDNILASALRGAAIIQDLLTLARRGVAISEVVNLNSVITDYLKSPEFEKIKAYHPYVAFATHLERELLNIKGSPVHLIKTMMNLLSNAAEAITETGEVSIRTENRYLDKPIRGYDDMREGDYVVLTVSDNGKGISPEDIGKIFEPFYTKKIMGRSGTGLGLAVVWGTVKDHDGYIDVQSEEGKGSVFTIYFPVTREEPSRAEDILPPAAYKGRGESILVVDDVKEQREVAISMLGRLGYHPAAVSSGEEAIEYLRHEKVDLVVLDMIMEPGIDGLETYRRMIALCPKQKAVIVSGFSETARVRQAQELGAGAYVRKPYVLGQIGLAIRRELDKI